MSQNPPRRLARALATAAVALPLLAVGAAPALAATTTPTADKKTYEQISRGPGASGESNLDVNVTPYPLWASDLGVLAAYNPTGRGDFSLAVDFPSTAIRNTRSDKSLTFGVDRGRLLATDKDEQIGLFQRLIKIDEYTYTRKYAIGRLDGSGSLRDIDTGNPDIVRLSGNGKFVITAGQLGLRRLELATGRWTTLAPLAFIGRAAVSDDGQTVAGVSFDQQAQRVDAVVWRGTKATTLIKGYGYQGPANDPQLSPDGSTVFTSAAGNGYPDPTVVTAYKVSNGKRTSTNLPFEKTYDARPIWVSPSGDQIAYALNYQDPDPGPLEPAKVWTVGAGWATFGGAFATSLANDGNPAVPSAVSRNGKYAVLAYNHQVALVSLAGTPLPGNALGNEGLSPTSYFDTPGINYCGFGFSSLITGSFTRPAFWAPVPKKAFIAIGDGTSVLQSAEWTNPAPWPHAANVEADSISQQFPIGAPHTRTLEIGVIDEHGRKTREQRTATVTCGAPTPTS